MKRILFSAALFVLPCVSTSAAEYLVKLKATDKSLEDSFLGRNGGTLELVSRTGSLYKWNTSVRHFNLKGAFRDQKEVEFIEANRTIHLPTNPSIEKSRDAFIATFGRYHKESLAVKSEKPDIQSAPTTSTTGADPSLNNAWGMPYIGADTAWGKTKEGEGIVVAVTDSGVDYNHEDLIANMWRNPNEIPGNGIDDDHNGYIDDVVGWDFTANDNKPYDVTASIFQIMLSGGNPGHGTHVSGVIGAVHNNGKGTSGVAPKVKIMALRFINETGEGDSAAAIKAIDYAIANGAKIINASWGSEGEDEDSKALKEALQRAKDAGVIFVAAAGNGRVDQATGKGVGYDNDTDDKPSYPATYDFDNIISVAANDSEGNLAEFSNFGKKTVDISAPGVKILSTVPGNKYQDTVIDLGSMKATWDGTSMATPFVVGSLAVIWSQNPTQSWTEVKKTLLSHVVSLSGLTDKVATGGHVSLNEATDR
jgi:thermitase